MKNRLYLIAVASALIGIVLSPAAAARSPQR